MHRSCKPESRAQVPESAPERMTMAKRTKAWERQAAFTKERKFPFKDIRNINQHLNRCERRLCQIRELLSKLMRETPRAADHVKGLHNDIDNIWRKIESYKVD